jgi:hypothetical protein
MEKIITTLWGTDVRVPKEGKQTVINDQFTRTIKGHDRGFIRPPERGLRLDRPLGHELHLIRPRGRESRPI